MKLILQNIHRLVMTGISLVNFIILQEEQRFSPYHQDKCFEKVNSPLNSGTWEISFPFMKLDISDPHDDSSYFRRVLVKPFKTRD